MAISKWNKSPLKALCNRIGDGLHGTPAYNDESDIFFINGNNLKNGSIVISRETKKVTSSDFENNYIELNDNSLLLSINGTLGEMAFYNGEKVMLGKSAAYLNFKTGINRFYYYYFQLKDIQEYFYNVATGSTIKNLGLKSIQGFEVPHPEEKEWQPIARLLSNLDKKIELNNKINTELEAMAKLIYDYWFVQFDFPDANGKPYKSSGGKMVYNEALKREIPDGWSVGKLTDVMSVQYGFPFSTKLFNDEKLGSPVIRIRNILDGSVSVYSSEEVGNKYLLEKGDLLIGMDGNFHLNFWDKGGCYLNQRCVRIRKKTGSLVSQFQALFEIEPYIKAREKNVSRTTVGHLSARDINDLNILVPSAVSVLNGRKFFDSMLDKIIVNRIENNKLVELRDWLLPMLMNGQVTVNSSTKENADG